MARGGRRPGAGRKKGSKEPSTLAKEAARELLRQTITAHMEPMVQAQIAHAIGIGHLYTRDKTGKFTKIESQDEADRLLRDAQRGKHYWIFTKDPSTQAFTDLMNRAVDKPAEQMQQVRVTGQLTVVSERLERLPGNAVPAEVERLETELADSIGGVLRPRNGGGRRLWTIVQRRHAAHDAPATRDSRRELFLSISRRDGGNQKRK